MNKQELSLKAQELLKNPAYQQAIMRVKADLFDEWSRNTMWDSKRKREKLWDMAQAAIAFENKLKKMIETADYELKQADRNKARSIQR